MVKQYRDNKSHKLNSVEYYFQIRDEDSLRILDEMTVGQRDEALQIIDNCMKTHFSYLTMCQITRPWDSE